jgi:hypothetical protein
MPKTPPAPPTSPAAPLHESAQRDTMVQAAFDSYLRDVIPLGAPTVQITESKRAFYAGAQAVLQIVVAIGEDDVTEEQGVAIFESCQRELQAFLRDVVGGRA